MNEKDFEAMKDVMLGHLILMAGRTSDFNQVSVTKMKDGIAVNIEGQTFAVINAVAAIISALHKNNLEMPLDVLLDMVCYATKTFGSDTCPYSVDKNVCASSKEELEKLMKDLFDKKDKE